VNDSYGHAVGDQILCRVADRLVASVRASDVVGRQSGDEFAIALDHVVADEEATAAAERILRELRRPIQLGGRSIVVGGSIGVAVSGHDTTVEDLLLHADAAMYAAKGDGKGTFAIYDARMPVRTWTELEAAG
jgi:diguanylate cyclase (GGDEF)-like protein